MISRDCWRIRVLSQRSETSQRVAESEDRTVIVIAGNWLAARVFSLFVATSSRTGYKVAACLIHRRRAWQHKKVCCSTVAAKRRKKNCWREYCERGNTTETRDSDQSRSENREARSEKVRDESLIRIKNNKTSLRGSKISKTPDTEQRKGRIRSTYCTIAQQEHIQSIRLFTALWGAHSGPIG